MSDPAVYFDYAHAVPVEVINDAEQTAWVLKAGNFYCDRRGMATTWLPAARKHETRDAAVWEMVNQQGEHWQETGA